MTTNKIVPDDVEYFSSAAEIAKQDDRVETDIEIQGWGKKLRIRALSFAQMEKINKLATDKDGVLDHAQWVYHTLVEGIVIPHLNIIQARDLADNNGTIIRELADEIWELGRISKRAWDQFMLEQKRLAEIEKTGNPDANQETSDSLPSE